MLELWPGAHDEARKAYPQSDATPQPTANVHAMAGRDEDDHMRAITDLDAEYADLVDQFNTLNSQSMSFSSAPP